MRPTATPAHREAPDLGAVMSPNLIWGLLRAADERGLASDGWLAGLGLDRQQLANPAIRVSSRQTAVVIERALPSLPACIGLDLGEHQNIGNFALLGLAMTTAPTLGDAIAIGLRYTPVVGGLMRFVESTADEPGTFALRAEMIVHAPAIRRFVCEEFFSSCLSLVSGLVGGGLRARRIEFAYPAPDYAARYAEVFDCPLAFDRPQHRLVLDAHWLATPLATYNPIASRQMLALLRAQMPHDARGDVAAAVERLLRTQLAGTPRLASIATQLHVSERTLRRQLTAEGTSFRELLDQLRVDHAYALLRDPALSIFEVGVQVGYRDPREFRRAFRRLTGSSPRAARERLLADGDAGADAAPAGLSPGT